MATLTRSGRAELDLALVDLRRKIDWLRGEAPRPRTRLANQPLNVGEAATVRAARRLNRAAGMIAGSVLADSAMEHYRGDFHNKAMWTPIVSATLSLAASLHGHTDRRSGAHRVRDVIYAAAGLTGIIGTGFHLYNITKKPGGFCWQNLFYSAPIGAPAALSLSGLMGWLSERVRDNRPGARPTVVGMPAGRAVAGLTSASLAGTVSEAGLLHFRGAFHNPFMLLPVSLPPIAAGLLVNAALGDAHVRRPFTRWWLRATTVMGIAGVAFHAYGVSRNMGGWRNWRQNAFAGPPLPAPPSFTGLAWPALRRSVCCRTIPMTEPTVPRYPGYDVLNKRQTPSWDAITRRVIDARLAVPREPRFLSAVEFETAQAVCRRILPQPGGRPEVPLAALLDAKLLADHGDGFREGGMPYMQEAWRQGLAAIETESIRRHAERRFASLDGAEQDALLGMMQRGELTGPAWDGLGAAAFFKSRILTDIAGLYYSHPTAWSEMGFGGPASPRGYVRMEIDRRDPWEAVQATPGTEAKAECENKHVV